MPDAALPETVEDILELLLALARSSAVRPMVTAHLRGGRDVIGQVRSRTGDGGRGSLVLDLPPTRMGAASDQRMWLLASDVQAFTIHEVSALARALEARQPPPTRIELERLLRDAAGEVSSAARHSLTVELGTDGPSTRDADAARGLAELIRRSVEAIRLTAVDELGRGALAELHRLIVGAGDPLRVAREGDALRIFAPIAGGTAGVPLVDEITRAIADAL